MSIEFGYASSIITPELPANLAGYFNIRMWKLVADDLYVKVAVFRQDGRLGAIVQYDVITASTELCDEFWHQAKLAQVVGFSPCNTIICATHTHTAPEVRLDGRPGDSPEFILMAASRGVKALLQALGDMQTGEIEVGSGFNFDLIFNRRYWMDNGRVITNPGKLNPHIKRPEGEIDPEIPLLAFKSQGRIKLLLASIVNHSDTNGGSNVSADWPGVARKLVEEKLGSETLFIPLIGAAGNINHFDVGASFDQTSYEETKRVGRLYAKSVIEALPELRPLSGDYFQIGSKSMTVGGYNFSEAELNEAQATVDRYAEVADPTTSDVSITAEDLANGNPVALKFFAMKILEMADMRERYRFDLTGLFFGSAGICSLPGEPFVEIGLNLRKSVFAGRHILVSGHANGIGIKGGGGYIPNLWNYGRGGYEVEPLSGPFEQATSRKLIEAWDEIRATLK